MAAAAAATSCAPVISQVLLGVNLLRRLAGREVLDDVIIRNAENISALEVEDVLLRHPDVADAAVLGLPDPRTGERVGVVVVCRPGATIDVASVAAHFAEQGIARQKTPEQVEVSTPSSATRWTRFRRAP